MTQNYLGPLFDHKPQRELPREQITVDSLTAARLLMIDRQTVRRLARIGELPSIQIDGPHSKILFRIASLKAWAREREQRQRQQLAGDALSVSDSSATA
jgi:excisionase family DNA binding protein